MKRLRKVVDSGSTAPQCGIYEKWWILGAPHPSAGFMVTHVKKTALGSGVPRKTAFIA
ncbi:hypothetical protein WDW89_05240 [Deltaproteobacteria bacterium TL4]